MLRVKKIAFVGSLAGLVSLMFTCIERHNKPSVEQSSLPVIEKPKPTSETFSAFSEASEGTRVALIQACGRCHQSTLASHKPKAVAIFDLDCREQWHDKLTEENLEGLARRAKKNNAISEEEFVLIEAFLSQKRKQLQ